MLGSVELRKNILTFTQQLTIHTCVFHSYFVNLSSEHFLMLPLHSLTLKMWEMTYYMPHFDYYRQTPDFYCFRGGHFGFLLINFFAQELQSLGTLNT